MTKIELDINEKSKIKHIFNNDGFSKFLLYWKKNPYNYFYFGKDYDSTGLKNFARFGWEREKENMNSKVKKNIFF